MWKFSVENSPHLANSPQNRFISRLSTALPILANVIPPFPQPPVEKKIKKCLALCKETGNVFMRLRWTDRVHLPGNRKIGIESFRWRKQTHRSRGLREDPPGSRPTGQSSSPLDAIQLERDTCRVPWTSWPSERSAGKARLVSGGIGRVVWLGQVRVGSSLRRRP